jgi:hypothetical protein
MMMFDRMFESIRLSTRLYISTAVLFLLLFASVGEVASQRPLFRVGEKLTYRMSFGHIPDAGFLELSVNNAGRLAGNNVVELTSRIKTRDLASAVLFLVDETRIAYADPQTGLPVYIILRDDSGPLPKETIFNYTKQPVTVHDLVTVIYKARESDGIGTFSFFEGNSTYTATFVNIGSEKVRASGGEFDTSVSTVTSDHLTALGIRDLKINFSNDGLSLPVLFRGRSTFGDFRIELSGQVSPLVQPVAPPIPAPVVVRTPTPTPVPTPEPYENDRPLLPELGFQLGERLEYRLTRGGQPAATLILSVRERRQIQGIDSLILTAEITQVSPGITDLVVGDGIRVQVSPETLLPKLLDSRFKALPLMTRGVLFDPISGAITVGSAKPVDAPVGTHSLLSLVYAMRSFNLKPSKDATNPVNDTRVAVFWDSKAHVFTLRPSDSEDLIIAGQRMSGQAISISTGVPVIDSLVPRVWLSNESGRAPLRFTLGAYTGEIVRPLDPLIP